MVLIDDSAGRVIALQPRVRDRVGAHLHAGAIDLDLARGASPKSSVQAALRARTLTSTRHRRQLADGLRRALVNATRPAHTSLAAATLNGRAVRAAKAEIEEARRLLLASGPVSVRGVARARVLLTSGAEPLHNPRVARHLPAALTELIDLLGADPVAA